MSLSSNLRSLHPASGIQLGTPLHRLYALQPNCASSYQILRLGGSLFTRLPLFIRQKSQHTFLARDNLLYCSLNPSSLPAVNGVERTVSSLFHCPSLPHSTRPSPQPHSADPANTVCLAAPAAGKSSRARTREQRRPFTHPSPPASYSR